MVWVTEIPGDLLEVFPVVFPAELPPDDPGHDFTFYLGTHQPQWLGKTEVPMFVSHTTLRGRRGLPQSSGPWCLDSGAFSEIAAHGRFLTPPDVYAESAHRYIREIGNVRWIAPQDYMCEPFMLARTGLSVIEHQRRTIDSYQYLRSQQLPVIPVLQGWTLTDYERHVTMYLAEGVDLHECETVGLGSVCRRQATPQIASICRTFFEEGLRLHGFGIKTLGLHRYRAYLRSADSMAWSFRARYQAPLPGHGVRHKNCANCMEYALRWYRELTGERVWDGACDSVGG